MDFARNHRPAGDDETDPVTRAIDLIREVGTPIEDLDGTCAGGPDATSSITIFNDTSHTLTIGGGSNPWPGPFGLPGGVDVASVVSPLTIEVSPDCVCELCVPRPCFRSVWDVYGLRRRPRRYRRRWTTIS